MGAIIWRQTIAVKNNDGNIYLETLIKKKTDNLEV